MLSESVLKLETENRKLRELLKKCNQAIDQVEKKVLVLNEDGETHEF